MQNEKSAKFYAMPQAITVCPKHEEEGYNFIISSSLFLRDHFRANHHTTYFMILVKRNHMREDFLQFVNFCQCHQTERFFSFFPLVKTF